MYAAPLLGLFITTCTQTGPFTVISTPPLGKTEILGIAVKNIIACVNIRHRSASAGWNFFVSNGEIPVAKRTLKQKLEGVENLNQALRIYIEHRKGEKRSTCFGNYNSFWGTIGRYDADSKINAAQNVIDEKRISQKDLSMLEDGRLASIMAQYDRPKNVIDAVKVSEQIAANIQARMAHGRW